MTMGVATAAVLLAVAAAALAQVQGEVRIQPAPAASAPAAAGDANALAGKESNQGVYVRDSAVAVEKFALAQRMERLKEWNKAADALQEVLEKHADRVMPSQVDAKNVIYQYTSVTTAVQEKLAKWPAEGLDVYRARFEPQAAAILENAAPEDVGALHKAYSLYFVTDTGKAAGLRLVDLYLESGEFPAAAWLAERLLAWHPSIDAERPRLTYRAALAQHLAGDAKSAVAKLDELKSKFADARGTVRGQEVVLADALAQELASTAPPVARRAAGDSWPMLGGAPDRGRVPEVGGRLGALINFVDYARAPRPRTIDPNIRNAILAEERRARESGHTLGVLPVVDRGEMFFQDNARVYAVSLETGVALPGWAATYGDRGGRYAAPFGTPLPPNQQFTVTVTDNAVLAVTGQVDNSMAMAGFGGVVDQGSTRLVCLDRATGKERWATMSRMIPDSAAQLRSVFFSGSPLVVGDNVYVLGRGGKPMQFVDSYVLCFSLKDGSYRWSCYLASGNADPNAMQNGFPTLGDNVTHMAYASGRLYALTNLGALAAIDAYSGTIVWLNIYPRPKPDFGGMRVRFDRTPASLSGPRPWHHNPVIVKDGKVFILPDDAQDVLVYDAGSGVELKRIRTSDFDSAKVLLAVVGDRLVLCGDRMVYCVNWANADLKRKPEEYTVWKSAPLAPKPVVRGRGFVTMDSVYVPTSTALFHLAMKDGMIQQTYPNDRVWDAGEGSGNVLVTPDHVIVATAERVNVYTDLTVAQQRLDASVAAAPNDPEPRLRYAEMMFVSGQLDVAADKLDEAVALLSGAEPGKAAPAGATMRSGAARDRVFNIALTFAQKLSDPDGGTDAGRKLAVELFDRAAAAADTPAQHVNYRMTRARFADPPEQVRLYQEILADARLRGVPYTGEEADADAARTPAAAPAAAAAPAGQVAGEVAEVKIAECIKRSGRAVYAPFEARAAEALAAARGANDAAALLEVAESYPNAAAAPDAMLGAADAYEAAGNHRAATRVLRHLIARHARSRSVDATRIIEAQVRNFVKLPNGVGSAIGSLSVAQNKAARLSKPITLPDGRTLENVTLSEVASALHAYSAQVASRSLPEFNLPDTNLRDASGKRIKPLLPEEPDSVIADVDMLVVPQRAHARHDRIVTWTANKGLSVYPVGRATPVGSAVAFADTPKGSAWLDDEKLLVWGATRCVLLAGASGAMLWESALKDLGGLEVGEPGEVVVDNGTPDDAQAAMRAEERVMMQGMIRARRGGLVANVVVNANGVPVQGLVPPQGGGGGAAAEHVEHVRPTADRIVFSTTTGRVAALDVATGKAAWQMRLVEGPVLQLLANDDFTVARVADNVSGAQIVALNTDGGEPAAPRRVFPIEMNNARQPINMALAPDGTLVWALPMQLCGKNLFDPGKQLNFQAPQQPATNALFAGANLPDQLVIANGRILALCEQGMYVRAFSMEGKDLFGTTMLPTQAQGWSAVLRPVGSRLHVFSPRSIRSYNLDNVEDAWPSSGPPVLAALNPPVNVRDIMIGQDYVVLLDQVAANPNPRPGAAAAAAPQQPPGPQQAYRLLGFSRAPVQRGSVAIEQGRFDVNEVVALPNTAITSEWQGVNGGFYYRAMDRTVHYARGARPAGAG